MNKLTVLLVMASCTGLGSHAAASGIAYKNSFYTGVNTPFFVNCRDLTEEEMDDADNLPGSGYNDGKWTGENPPTNEDEDGNPSYAAQQVFEDDKGNIYILEDDGEITEIPA